MKVTQLLVVVFCATLLFAHIGERVFTQKLPPSVQVRHFTPQEVWKVYLLEHAPSYRVYKKLNKIIQCESRWNKDAINYETNDIGLFQISLPFHLDTTKEAMLNPYKNLDYGLALYAKNGYLDWEWSRKVCWGKP